MDHGPLPFRPHSPDPAYGRALLTWPRVEDPDGDPVEYEVLLSDVHSLPAQRTIRRHVGADTCFALDESEGIVPALYWNVVASDGVHSAVSVQQSLEIPWQPHNRLAAAEPGDLHLAATAPPHVALRDVDVGGDLRIEAGANLLIWPGVRIRVAGDLIISGEPDEPVAVGPMLAGQPWGAIAVEGERVRVAHAVFTGGGRDSLDTPISVLRVRDASVEVLDSTFRDHLATAIDVVGGEARVLRSTFGPMRGEGIHATGARLDVDDCVFQDIDCYCDAIDIDGDGDGLSRIANSRFARLADDGIDLLQSEVRIEACTILDCADKGVSVEGVGSPFIVNCLIAGCEIGVAFKDECDGRLVSSTVAGNRVGVQVYRKNRVGGAGEILASIIWGNSEGVVVDSVSRCTVAYSDLQEVAPSSLAGLVLGPGLLHLDPRWLDAAGGDFSLATGSPCIDAAGSDPRLPAHDLLGVERRIASAGAPFVADLGAFEFVPESPPAPSRLVLGPLTPSPAMAEEVRVPFAMPQAGRARLVVYDAAGRLIRVLHDGEMAAGPAEILWDRTDASWRPVPSGVYLLSLGGGGEEVTAKLVILR
jgi:hypothetical protein